MSYLVTDPLGSVLSNFSNGAGTAHIQGIQLYNPYGTRGMVPTDKGFTGQYLDASGLNYDHARYYDPVVGRFVSADTKQGNMQGMDPYSYVGNDPETLNDPTGQRFCDPTGKNCGQPCGGNCSPDPGPPDPPVNCHGGGPRACTSGGVPPSSGGCGPRCTSDKNNIKQFYVKQQAKDQAFWNAIGDGVSILGDILALAADWGNDWPDFFFTLLTSFLPHALAFGVDVTKALGGQVWPWLNSLTGYVKGAVAVLNGFRSYLRWLDPTSGILGWIKDLIVHETKNAIQEGIGLLISGIGAPGIASFSLQAINDKYAALNTQVDNYSASDALTQCQLLWKGAVQC